MIILTLAVLAGLIVSCIACPQTRAGQQDELSLLETQLRENRDLSKQMQAGLENSKKQHQNQPEMLDYYEMLESVLRQVQHDCGEDLRYAREQMMQDGYKRLFRKKKMRRSDAQLLSLLAVQRQIALLQS